MRTPAPKTSKKPKPAKSTQAQAAAPPRTAAKPNRPAGIFLSRPAKAEENPGVPASIWALADTALGNESEANPPRDAQDEAESDNADVTEALDDSGTPRITR
jgi:hypothetical protein